MFDARPDGSVEPLLALQLEQAEATTKQRCQRGALNTGLGNYLLIGAVQAPRTLSQRPSHLALSDPLT